MSKKEKSIELLNKAVNDELLLYTNICIFISGVMIWDSIWFPIYSNGSLSRR